MKIPTELRHVSISVTNDRDKFFKAGKKLPCLSFLLANFEKDQFLSLSVQIHGLMRSSSPFCKIKYDLNKISLLNNLQVLDIMWTPDNEIFASALRKLTQLRVLRLTSQTLCCSSIWDSLLNYNLNLQILIFRYVRIAYRNWNSEQFKELLMSGRIKALSFTDCKISIPDLNVIFAQSFRKLNFKNKDCCYPELIEFIETEEFTTGLQLSELPSLVGLSGLRNLSIGIPVNDKKQIEELFYQLNSKCQNLEWLELSSLKLSANDVIETLLDGISKFERPLRYFSCNSTERNVHKCKKGTVFLEDKVRPMFQSHILDHFIYCTLSGWKPDVGNNVPNSIKTGFFQPVIECYT